MTESEYAEKAVALTKQLGDIIERLAGRGYTASLTIGFTDSARDMILYRLNGEFKLEIGRYESLTGRKP